MIRDTGMMVQRLESLIAALGGETAQERSGEE